MKDKVALITGAASGFGAETAVVFASKGCLLALVDKDPMENTSRRCIEAGLTKEQILLIQVNLTVQDELKELPGKAVDYFGRLDVLVNNAGTATIDSLVNTDEEAYDRNLGLNCKVVFFLSQYAVPYLAKTKGNIVNVSSVFGLTSGTTCTAYRVSKAGVNQITQCSALELAPQKIRVNAVNPGHAKTGLFTAAGIPEDQVQPFIDEITELYPMGRIAEPVEIARAIAFLADDFQAGFITGVCLLVDGGLHLGNSRI